ncbi:hypothetical protein THRCLA_00297, partial [Thraustotheca clavata]
YHDRQEREQPFLNTRHVFDMVSNARLNAKKHRHHDGIRGLEKETYIATLEHEKTPVLLRVSESRQKSAIYDRAIENFERNLKQNQAMPKEELIDYIVHCASLKTSNVPELWGTFDTSAAIVSAIVVEEYTKQLVDEYIARGNHHILSGGQEQLQHCIQDLLNGAVCEPDCRNDLEAAIVSELTNVFGQEVINAYDLPKLIQQSMNPLIENVEDDKWKQWKNERIQQGIEALQEGAVMSPDGIHVDITQGIPSYWFCVALPHGKQYEMVSSERYPSYQLAFETKLQLEQRINENKKAFTIKPPAMPIQIKSKTQHPWKQVQKPLIMPSIQEVECMPNVKKVLEKVAMAQRGVTEEEARRIEVRKRLLERGYIKDRPAKKQTKYIYKRKTMSTKDKELRAARVLEQQRKQQEPSFRALLGTESAQDSYSDEEEEEEDMMAIECWCPKCGNDIRHKSKSSQSCEVFKFWKKGKESTVDGTMAITFMDDPTDLFFQSVNEWRHNGDNSLFHRETTWMKKPPVKAEPSVAKNTGPKKTSSANKYAISPDTNEKGGGKPNLQDKSIVNQETQHAIKNLEAKTEKAGDGKDDNVQEPAESSLEDSLEAPIGIFGPQFARRDTEDLCFALGMKTTEVQKLVDVFNDIDVNCSGLINLVEFYYLLDTPQNPYTLGVLRLSQERKDPNKLEIDDFIQIICKFARMQPREVITFCFETFDEDESGALDNDEFLNLCKAIQVDGKGFFDGNFKRAMENFDKNGDGLLDMQEFQQINVQYPLVFYPLFQFQVKVITNTLGWWKWYQITYREMKIASWRNYMHTHLGREPPLQYQDYLFNCIYRTNQLMLIAKQLYKVDQARLNIKAKQAAQSALVKKTIATPAPSVEADKYKQRSKNPPVQPPNPVKKPEVTKKETQLANAAKNKAKR